MASYPPTVFIRGLDSQTAYTWEDHWNLIWDGWKPGPAAPSQSELYAPVARQELADFRTDPDISGFRDALAEFIAELGGGGSGAAPNRGLVNGEALKPWHTALAGWHLAPASIVAIGDSITEGCLASHYTTTWPARLQALVRARLGLTGGLGYVPAAPTTGAVVPNPLNTRVGTANQGAWGLGGRSMHIAGAATQHVTYDAQVCDRIRVWYGKSSFLTHRLRVLIDGVDQGVELDCAGPENSDGHSWLSPALTDAAHVVKVVPASDFTGIHCGVDFYRGDYNRGVRVYNAAHYGYTTTSFLTANMEMHWQAVVGVDPDLAIIMLGANDLANAATSPTQYGLNLDAIIAKIPAGVPVLLMSTWRRGDHADKDIRWEQMVAQAQARATGRVAFLDVRPWWPTIASVEPTGEGLMTDLVHPNTAGMEVLAGLVVDAITAPVHRS